MGSELPKTKLLCSRAPLHALLGSRNSISSKFEKIAMGIVWAPGLQAFKMMGSRLQQPPPPLWRPLSLCNDLKSVRDAEEKLLENGDFVQSTILGFASWF